MPARKTSAKKAADWIEKVTHRRHERRHLDADQQRQGEEEPEELDQRRRGAEDLDDEAGRPRRQPVRRQPHQRQHQAEHEAAGQRHAGHLQRVEQALRQQVGVGEDRGEVPRDRPQGCRRLATALRPT